MSDTISLRDHGAVGDQGVGVEDVRIRDLAPAWLVVEGTDALAESNPARQYSSRAARRARAGIVLEHMRGLDIDGLSMRWPDAPVPEAWRFAWARDAPARIAGDLCAAHAGHALLDVADSVITH